MPPEHSISLGTGHQSHKVSVVFEDRGKDLLILLHGLGGSKEDFSMLYTAEGFGNISLLSFDFLGFGHSDKPDKGGDGGFSYSMEAQAEVCGQLIRAYEGYRMHMAAHSMGAAIALLLPDEILRQIVSFANLEGNLIDKDCFLSRKVSEISFEKFENELLPKMQSKLEKDKFLLADLNQAFPLAYHESCKSLVKWSDSGRLLEKFRSLTQHKAYFYGQRNADIEPLKQLKGIDKIQIDNSGHMMMLDNPKDFSDKLKQFLPV